MKDVALILETNNLRGGNANRQTVLTSMERLLLHLKKQTLDINSLREIIITHDDISEEEQTGIIQKVNLGNIRFLKISTADNYYQAKELGFKESQASIVVFADSDCLPVDGWLEEILLPFEKDGAEVVSGRTTYDNSIFGIAATTIDFMYFGSVINPKRTKNFYANNIAFKREIFNTYHFTPIEGQYRGQCQALGLKLLKSGIPMHFSTKAKTVHRFPDSFLELVKLRIYRGQDTVGLTPFLANAHLPSWLRWLKYCGPVLPTAILIVRFFCSIFSIGKQDMPKVNVFQWLLTALYISFISLFDFIGMVLGSLSKLIPFIKLRENRYLSYHSQAKLT